MNYFGKFTKIHKKAVIIFSVCMAAFIFLGIVFVLRTWKDEVAKTKSSAFGIANAAGAGLTRPVLDAVTQGEDWSEAEYSYLKRSLSEIAAQDENIRFACVYAMKDGKVFIIADSEQEGSPDYSPPWQLYDEADKELYSLFESGKEVITDSYIDRWGKWVSAFIPLKDAATGETIAALGLDFPADSWYDDAKLHTTEAAIIVFGAAIIITGIFYLTSVNSELSKDRKRLLEMGKKLRESSSLFRSVFDQADVGIAIVHNYKFILPSGAGIPSMNKRFEEILGRSNEELLKIDWPDITHTEDLSKDLELFSKFRSGEIDGYELEKRFIRPDGCVVWVRMIVSTLHLENNTEKNHLCIIEDISKSRELENTLRESERSKAVLLDNLPGMFYRCKYDADWTMLSVSNGFYELTGYTPEKILQNTEMSFNEIIVPDYRDYLYGQWERVIADKGKLTAEYEIVCAGGERKWVWEQGQGVYGESGEVIALEGLVLDVTDRKNYEIKLKYQGEHEPLTGLLNFRSFEQIYSQRKPEEDCALILINVRKFSLINSALGYHTGRKLIRDIAKCLKKLSSQERMLFQMSADRFLFYVMKSTGKNELNRLGGKIIAALDKGVFLKTVGFDIGVLEIPSGSAEGTEDALKKVYITAENAGHGERFGCRFFNDEMEKRILRENAVTRALTNAAYDDDDKSIFIEYQPIIDLKTGKVRSFEALARLRNEELGTVPPDEFISIAESSQLILPLGRRIMRLVFAFAASLAQSGLGPVSMSFNVSALQFQSETFITDIKSLIDETGADPGRLRIELTESVFLGDLQVLNMKIDEVKKLGMKISLDDFGTGYSSLSRLTELGIDYLKIDKEFIDKITPDTPEKTIVADIISMAHKLGCAVVAEGVEKAEQSRCLKTLGCDMIQGYLCGRPSGENESLELLARHNLERAAVI